MATAREKAIRAFLDDLEQILPGHKNREIYETYFATLDDAAFHNLMVRLQAGELTLPLYVPNASTPRLDHEQLLKTAKLWGHRFFERVWVKDPTDPSVEYLTPKEYLTIELPFRRQAQTLKKKMSVPMSDTVIDDLTGQSTGESKGSAISLPELQVLRAEGHLDPVILELIKVRGGDAAAYRQMEKTLLETGSASLEPALRLGTLPKSTQTLSALLKSGHLANNLAE